jgi:hypothetical protein
MGPEVTALVHGELFPSEEASIRAHVASCAACGALAEDVRRISAATAARPSPVPDAASRARLSRALDAAWAEADEVSRSRGPALRLLDYSARRYAESRTVRFLAWSVAGHAAAAVVLGLWLAFPRDGGAPSEPAERAIEIATAPLPPPYEDDPIREASMPKPTEIRGIAGIEAPGWIPAEDLARGPLGVPPIEDPVDLKFSLKLYPNSESRDFARGRFRRDLREKALAGAWGPVEGPNAALSVERGLRWLAGEQDADGTWASGRPGDPKPQRDRFRGGVTGVSLLAILGDGRTAMRPGPYAKTARDAVTALVRSADPATGLVGGFAPRGADDRPLCNHGPALEALAEAYLLDYGRLRPEALEQLTRVVARAVKASLAAQLPDGSFGYAPGARAGDTSVTLLQVAALESARRAGFEVDAAAMKRAGEYLAARVGPDGRLGYREAGDRSMDATLTAEALPLAKALGLSEDVRARMRKAVLDEAATAASEERVLFRTALLRILPGDADVAARGAVAARAALSFQGPAGAFPSEPDRYARAAGDVLATARTLRALTAPYRGGL